MKRVTLYTVNQKLVLSHSAYIPTVTNEPIVRCVNSSDVFYRKVDHLPIKRFCFTQEDGTVDERFVAFDRELEDIIQAMLDDYTSGLQYGYKKAHERLTDAFETRIKSLESRTIWDIIKLKLSRLYLTK